MKEWSTGIYPPSPDNPLAEEGTTEDFNPMETLDVPGVAVLLVWVIAVAWGVYCWSNRRFQAEEAVFRIPLTHGGVRRFWWAPVLLALVVTLFDCWL